MGRTQVRIGGDEYLLPFSQEQRCRCGMSPVVLVLSAGQTQPEPYCRMCYRVKVVLPKLDNVLSMFP